MTHLLSLFPPSPSLLLPTSPSSHLSPSLRYKAILISMMESVLKKAQLHYNMDELREIDDDALDDDVRTVPVHHLTPSSITPPLLDSLLSTHPPPPPLILPLTLILHATLLSLHLPPHPVLSFHPLVLLHPFSVPTPISPTKLPVYYLTLSFLLPSSQNETEWHSFLRQSLEFVAKVAELFPLEAFQLLLPLFENYSQTYLSLGQIIVQQETSEWGVAVGVAL